MRQCVEAVRGGGAWKQCAINQDNAHLISDKGKAIVLRWPSIQHRHRFLAPTRMYQCTLCRLSAVGAKTSLLLMLVYNCVLRSLLFEFIDAVLEVIEWNFRVSFVMVQQQR